MAIAGDPRVVSRGEPRRTEALCELQHGVEANRAVAAHAGIGCLAGRVAADEAVHNLGAEALAQVERDVWDAHAVSQGARPGNRLGRAARALAVGAGSDHNPSVTPATWSPASSASCAAAALSTPRIATSVRRGRARAAAAPPRAPPSARWEGVGRERGAWRFGGISPPARRPRGSAVLDLRGGEEGLAVDQLDTALPAGARPHPLGVEAGLRDAVALHAPATRTRSPQAAPPAAAA